MMGTAREIKEMQMEEMRMLSAASQRTLDIQVAANQRLQSQVHTLTERLDAVVDAALAKDAELAEVYGKVARLSELLEQAQGQRDRAQAELNRILARVEP